MQKNELTKFVNVYADTVCDVLQVATMEEYKYLPVEMEEGMVVALVAPREILREIVEFGDIDKDKLGKVITVTGKRDGDVIEIYLGANKEVTGEAYRIASRASKIIRELVSCRLAKSINANNVKLLLN